MLNTSTSLISDVIGNDTANSAFVYGCYSLFDKFANGILCYYMIAYYSDSPTGLRYILSVTPVVSSISGTVFAYLGNKYYSKSMQLSDAFRSSQESI